MMKSGRGRRRGQDEELAVWTQGDRRLELERYLGVARHRQWGFCRDQDQTWSTSAFGGNSAIVSNPYLPISRFHRCVLSGHDTGEHLRVVRVLEPRRKTLTYRGRKVKVAVVKDRVTNLASTELIEQTIDYFAQDRAGNAYYFGEAVNEYKNGIVVGHSGSWQVGLTEPDRAS